MKSPLLLSKKAFPTLFLALLIFSAAVFSPLPATAATPLPDGWYSDLAKAVTAANELSDKGEGDAKILVDLYADWCGWCKVLEREVLDTPEFEKFADEQKFVILRVDTEDGAEGSALQARYQASSLPTTLILNRDLVKLGAISGYAPMETFVRYIEEQLQAWQILEANYDMVMASGDANLQRDLARDFHTRGAGRQAAGLYEKALERVKPGTSQALWMTYFAADAHRLAKNFERARILAERTGKLLTEREGEGDIQERVDLLSFYIAQDDGDCKQAVNSLEAFLTAHPRSFLHRELKQTLSRLNNDPACT